MMIHLYSKRGYRFDVIQYIRCPERKIDREWEVQKENNNAHMVPGQGVWSLTESQATPGIGHLRVNKIRSLSNENHVISDFNLTPINDRPVYPLCVIENLLPKIEWVGENLRQPQYCSVWVKDGEYQMAVDEQEKTTKKKTSPPQTYPIRWFVGQPHPSGWFFGST